MTNLIHLLLTTTLIFSSLPSTVLGTSQGQSPYLHQIGSAGRIVPSGIYIYMNGKRVAMEENGKKFFFHPDHLGSTSLMTDESGAQVKYLEYHPYGDTKVEQGEKKLSRKFTGKELDDSTGLYDYSARQYDAKICRFISADIAAPNLADPQSLNRYSYVLNNPLRYIDPTGKYQVDINEVQLGDVALQRGGTNLVSVAMVFAYQKAKAKAPYYGHTGIVVQIEKNKKGRIDYIRIGDLRQVPENKHKLSRVPSFYWGDTRLMDPFQLGGETLGDYDYFRVTNNSNEANNAARKADLPSQHNIVMDADTGKSLIFSQKDISSPDDNKMLCSEYVNYLYDNKFHDPYKGVTLPSHIYEYQKRIERPQEKR